MTLFPDSEIFVKEKPTTLTRQQTEKLIKETALQISNYAYYDIEEVESDIESLMHFDSAEMVAIELCDNYCYEEKYQSRLEKAFDVFFAKKQEMINENIAAWERAHAPKKVLHLTLFSVYFIAILNGKKKTEYRDITPYWKKRLLNADGTPRHYDVIKFKNGYASEAPFMVVEYKSLDVTGCFELNLGNIIESGNIGRLKGYKPQKQKQPPVDYILGSLFYNYDQLSYYEATT